ncbi:hypothetical protein OAN22_00595 [Alphaproteobacteria bacterium]|nr:hypothetical protein [Alphaproteobacteria bacterium]
MTTPLKMTPTGALFIIAGTAVGAGMLGLPLASASFSIGVSLTLLGAAWAYSLLAGIVILKLYRQHKTHNLPEMARDTLGPWAQGAMLLAFNLLCGCLVATYSTGGGELLFHFFHSFDLIPQTALTQGGAIVAFCLIFSGFIYRDLRTSDHVNRTLFVAKVLCLIMMGVLLYKALGSTLLRPFTASTPSYMTCFEDCGSSLWVTFLVFLASFGYHVALPSVFHHTPQKALGPVLFLSTLIPLGMYFIWELLVKGAVFYDAGSFYLTTTAEHQLPTLLSALGAHHSLLSPLASWFSFFAISTSFIGVGVALYEGMKALFKPHTARIYPFSIAFFIPMMIALFVPQLFVKGLAWAGVASTTYAMVIPGLMGWRTLDSIGWRMVALSSGLLGLFIIGASFNG